MWRSFELDPHAPRERTENLTTHLAAKYRITPEQAGEMQRHITETAATEGLEFHLDRARGGNTFDAHRLLHLAAEHGLCGRVKERLLRAYLNEGEPIGNRDVLVRLAAESGVEPDAASAMLAGDRYAEAVRADEAEAFALGIRSVPFFVIDRRYGVSGAQPARVLVHALERSWNEARGLEMVAEPAAGVCTDEGCAI